MRIVEADSRWAWAEGRGQRERLDCALLGPLPVGTWVLGFAGAAREVLDPERAAAIDAALDAVFAVDSGSPIDLDACFPDLVGRSPELPAHLKTEVMR